MGWLELRFVSKKLTVEKGDEVEEAEPRDELDVELP